MRRQPRTTGCASLFLWRWASGLRLRRQRCHALRPHDVGYLDTGDYGALFECRDGELEAIVRIDRAKDETSEIDARVKRLGTGESRCLACEATIDPDDAPKTYRRFETSGENLLGGVRTDHAVALQATDEKADRKLIVSRTEDQGLKVEIVGIGPGGASGGYGRELAAAP